MKKFLTFTLAATLSIGFALANSTKPASLSAPASKSAAVSLPTISQLASENQQLREALAVLQSESEELKSQISYQQLMAGLMTKINKLDQEHANDEATATISYLSAMTQVMLFLQSSDNREQQAELIAQKDYQKTMRQALAGLRPISVK